MRRKAERVEGGWTTKHATVDRWTAPPIGAGSTRQRAFSTTSAIVRRQVR
jgi:hypothetical protein